MYINSFCSISSAGIISPASNTGDLKILTEARAVCMEPDYKELIPPMQLRRMSKPVRTGVAAAKLCLKSAQDFMPESIHVGTAYGMLDDSENFLKKLMDQEEQMLNPTAFIQSTHNTVSGQIALSIGCTAHNMTYVHNAHSFESALLDASLSLADSVENKNILIGAVEECTTTSYDILKRFEVYNESNKSGEGASFFAVSKEQQTESIAHLAAFEVFKAKEEATLESIVSTFIETHQIQPDHLFIHGIDMPNSALLSQAITYQEFSGKYATMAGFGLAFACMKLREQDSNKVCLLNGFGQYYSLMLLSKP